MSSGHTHKYEMLVSASSAEAAMATVAEALPKGAEVVTASAIDCSTSHGPDSWRVSLTYRGGKRASSDLVE